MSIRSRVVPSKFTLTEVIWLANLHLPVAAIQFGDGQSRQLEMVGQKDQALVVLGIVVLYPPQLGGVILSSSNAGQLDGLIATQTARLVDGMRINPLELQIRLGANHEEGLRLVQAIKPREVDVAP